MGQLLLDGVPIGVPDRSVTAGGVSYDDTATGLGDDLQEAVDALGWKSLGSASGTNTISLPSGWKELNMCVYISNVYIPLFISRSWLESSTNYVRGGYYSSSQYNLGTTVVVSSGSAYIQKIDQNGSDVTSNGKLKILYR